MVPRKPRDLISYALRRVALLRQFSRSPVGGAELEVQRRPDPKSLDTDVDRWLELTVSNWSLYEQTLFVETGVAACDGGPEPVAGLVIFSSCAVRFPLSAGTTKVAIPLPATHLGSNVGLAFVLADGRIVVEWEPGPRGLRGDPSAALFQEFQAEMSKQGGGTLLEIGSRARSGNTYRHIVPEGWHYVGMDVMAGENVDIVGDAHDLAAVVGDQRFDAVFSVSVFEHLLMPWKVAVEINRVLRPGGLVCITTHQSFPLHDQPWDFWRFSDRAWIGLFNEATGFEILGVALGEPAVVAPRLAYAGTWVPQPTAAFLLSTVLARKIGDTDVRWDVDAAPLLQLEYPA